MIAIREAVRDDIALLYDLYKEIGKKDPGYFEHAMDQNITVLIASLDGNPCGFCLYNNIPRYSLYKALDIPEIQDLNVVPSARRNGVATALIKFCEKRASAEGRAHIGIAVGLFKDYGPAQILYVQLGYIPDGNGVTYDREGVKPYSSYMMDDDLSLMMIKEL